MAVLCNSTIFVSVLISLNCCFNFFGVVLNAPTTTKITCTGISHIFFNSLQIVIITFHLIFLPLFNSAITGTSNLILVLFGLASITSVCIVSSHIILQELFSTTFSGLCLYHFSYTSKPIFLHTSQCIFLHTKSCPLI